MTTSVCPSTTDTPLLQTSISHHTVIFACSTINVKNSRNLCMHGERWLEKRRGGGERGGYSCLVWARINGKKPLSLPLPVASVSSSSSCHFHLPVVISTGGESPKTPRLFILLARKFMWISIPLFRPCLSARE